MMDHCVGMVYFCNCDNVHAVLLFVLCKHAYRQVITART